MRKLKDITYLALNLNADVFNQMKALPPEQVSEMIDNEFSEVVELTINYRGFSVDFECNLYQAIKLDTIFNVTVGNFIKTKENNCCDTEKPFLHHIDDLLLNHYKSDLLDSPVLVKGYHMESSFPGRQEKIDEFLEHWDMIPGDSTNFDNILQSLISPNSKFGMGLVSIGTETDHAKFLKKRADFAEAIVSLYEISDWGCFNLNGAMIVLADILEKKANSFNGNKILIDEPDKDIKKFDRIRNDFIEYVDLEQESVLEVYEKMFNFDSPTKKRLTKNKIVEILNNSSDLPPDEEQGNSSSFEFKI